MAQADPISVSEAVATVSGLVGAMPTLVVRGEVTGFKGPHARTGHCYFSLKDPGSSMEAIVWRGVHESSGVQLRDGLEVILTGRFDVYQPTGKLSFKATSLQVAGEGLLRQQVAELARRLEREGLMDPARKRPIPAFCTRVCVVTSLSGDVIEDVKRTLARRNPLVQIDVVGCAVQGPDAPPTIVRALERAAASRPEAILLVRGGGSLENLMCFNDESVARAIAACPVPVVTGIGHEPDTTIADMVADRRQSTPTAAAESVAPAFSEIARQTNARQQRLATSMCAIVSKRQDQLALLSTRAYSAADKAVLTRHEKVRALGNSRFLRDPSHIVEARRDALEQTGTRLFDALPLTVARREEGLRSLSQRMGTIGAGLLAPYQAEVARGAATLDALSPLKVLGRGYSMVRDASGHVVSDARGLASGDEVWVTLAQGGFGARVTEVEDGSAARPAV